MGQSEVMLIGKGQYSEEHAGAMTPSSIGGICSPIVNALRSLGAILDSLLLLYTQTAAVSTNALSHFSRESPGDFILSFGI